MNSWVVLLRLVHILTSVFWVGAHTFNAFVLFPSVRGAGPAGGQVMQQLVAVRRMPILLMIASILTLLSGIGLMVHDGAVSGGAWYRSAAGQTFSAGAAIALIGSIISMATVTPTARKLSAIGAASARGESPEQRAQLPALQAKLGTWLRITAVILLVATAAMAVARYVGG